MWFARVTEISACSANDTEIYVDWCFDGAESRVAHLEDFVKNVWNHYARLFLTPIVGVVPSKI